jgi:hypothetical protein
MMRIKLLPKGGIYKVNFGYRSKMGGYTMSMLDIPNLAAMLDFDFHKRKAGMAQNFGKTQTC